MYTNATINTMNILVAFQNFVLMCSVLGFVYFITKQLRVMKYIEEEHKEFSRYGGNLEDRIIRLETEFTMMKDDQKASEEEYAKQIEDWLFSE